MFRSFFLAGFEGSTGYNKHGAWFDQIAATQHELHVTEDYARLQAAGIHAAREAVRWPLVDRGRGYDFSSVAVFLAAAREYEIEIIWDLFHYGYPPDLDLFSPAFPGRFAQYCRAAARYINPDPERVCYFTPINEASFFAWAGGETGDFAPHCRQRGPELKLALARAAIAGINAIWEVCPHARMVNVDPLCRVAPVTTTPHLVEAADRFNRVSVFETFDLLCGRLRPDLGGSRRHLDIIGLNYYRDNQWVQTPGNPPLAENDPRRTPLGDLLYTIWKRYGGDIMITETSQHGEGRPGWVSEVVRESERALHRGVPLAGVCLYPIIGMPRWHEPEVWERMGMWDLVDRAGTLHREPHAGMQAAVRSAQTDYEPAFLRRYQNLCHGRDPAEAALPGVASSASAAFARKLVNLELNKGQPGLDAG